jgi:ADP-heptose:LPS heptosyltransferase
MNAVGKYNINQSASLIRQSKLVITHDTGLMHIAAAFKKKILSVWGHTIPEFGMYPYLPDPDSRIFETRGLKCRPCTKIGKAECPKGHFRCINDIDNDAIASAANELY